MKNYFQFACELEPIDRFPGCMSKDDLNETKERVARTAPTRKAERERTR